MRVLLRWAVFISSITRRFLFGFLIEPFGKRRCRSGNSKSPLAFRSADSGHKSNLRSIGVRPENEIFEGMHNFIIQSTNGNPLSQVHLDESHDGIRGVYVNKNVDMGQIILSVPLSLCIRDDQLPEWASSKFPTHGPDFSSFDDDDHGTSDWAIRIATSLLDLQLRAIVGDEIGMFHELWLALLPNPSFLRASLPIHWSDDVLSSAKCTALDLAVDSSFFSRAQAIQDLTDIFQECPSASSLEPQAIQEMIDNTLDLVQTRSCRVITGDINPVRILAPLFDFINHSSDKANAEFYLCDEHGSGESSFLAVRALMDIESGSEVFINYGASAQPNWRCLNSYGFVPTFRPGIPARDGEHTAEVFLEGERFLVSPDSVSEDLVLAMARAMGESGGPRAVLTPEIALRLAQRISEAAFQILLCGDGSSAREDMNSDEDVVKKESEDAGLVISERLAAELRWDQHRILLACSIGLRDWTMKSKRL